MTRDEFFEWLINHDNVEITSEIGTFICDLHEIQITIDLEDDLAWVEIEGTDSTDSSVAFDCNFLQCKQLIEILIQNDKLLHGGVFR